MIGQVGIIKVVPVYYHIYFTAKQKLGLVGELNPRPLIAEARTIPLDQQAFPLRNGGNGCTYDFAVR